MQQGASKNWGGEREKLSGVRETVAVGTAYPLTPLIDRHVAHGPT
jgi:hypothetical protein